MNMRRNFINWMWSKFTRTISNLYTVNITMDNVQQAFQTQRILYVDSSNRTANVNAMHAFRHQPHGRQLRGNFVLSS